MRDGQQGRNPIKAQLRELFSEFETYNKERKTKYAEIEAIEKKLQNS